jgi:hypothetical protein
VQLPRQVKKLTKTLAIFVVASLALGRCAFEGGAFSGQVVSIPNDVVVSAIFEGDKRNAALDKYVEETTKQLQRACWQSGWRWFLRTLLWTGPKQISIRLTSPLIEPREFTVECSEV